MVFNLIPERIMGKDSDALFAYTTPKVVWVRDRYIGLCYYLLVFLAMSWVLLGQILWRNEHFQLKDVKGVPRMWITHPTINQCDHNLEGCMADYKPLSALPYCNEHDGGAMVKKPANCIFADKHTLLPDGLFDSKVFIPTSVVLISEHRHCRPSHSNGYSCDSEYIQDWSGRESYVSNNEMSFYADVESYVIQFTSTYHRDSIQGTSLNHPGFYYRCDDPRELKDRPWEVRVDEPQGHDDCEDLKRVTFECAPGARCNKERARAPPTVNVHQQVSGDLFFNPNVNPETGEIGMFMQQAPGGIPGPAGRRLRAGGPPKASLQAMHSQLNRTKEPEERRETPEVFSSSWGDMFQLGKLLKLANMDLDRDFNIDGMSTRMAGSILEIEVIYENLVPFLSTFGGSQVQYTYRVKEKKLPYMSKEYLAPVQPAEYPERRTIVYQGGLLIVFTVAGQFGFFSIVYLLLMLTTSLALLATAHSATDFAAIYVHPRKRNYFHLKYEVSPDFSDGMWKCPKCGYFNNNDQAKCKGLDQFMSEHDQGVELCGEPRPADIEVDEGGASQ
jgi:hypothetical protein